MTRFPVFTHPYMILTRQNIHAALNWGSPNAKQCELLGLTVPLPSGWLSKLVGSEMGEEQYARLIALKKPLKPRNVPQQAQVDGDKQGQIDWLKGRLAWAVQFIEALEPEGNGRFALNFDKAPWHSADEWLVDAKKLLDAPERFANELFEQSGRDLA